MIEGAEIAVLQRLLHAVENEARQAAGEAHTGRNVDMAADRAAVLVPLIDHDLVEDHPLPVEHLPGRGREENAVLLRQPFVAGPAEIEHQPVIRPKVAKREGLLQAAVEAGGFQAKAEPHLGRGVAPVSAHWAVSAS